MKTKTKNNLWNTDQDKNFGRYAITYATGDDIILDRQLVQYECRVNQAYMSMLAKQGILTENKTKPIISALEKIKKLDQQGKFVLDQNLEDVHSNVEQYIIDKLGVAVGGNLRLGMARNDQIYTDTRLYLKDQIATLIKIINNTIGVLSKIASQHLKTIMPGYTHLRISQPITYAHYLTSKIYHLLDDVDNLIYDFELVNKCPLGIFEMAGTHLNIDRKYLSAKLGFASDSGHSLYTANSRGEIEAKVISSLVLLSLHIRRTMNELIIFSTHEFGLLDIDDQYTSGGTAQPNLTNPDTLEVLRANMAKLPALFQETVAIMDMLPSGFMRDTQQTKAIIFQSFDYIKKGLPIFEGIMSSLKINRERMAVLADKNFSTAPDMCIQVAIKGKISFRQAYLVIKYIIKSGYLENNLNQLTPQLISDVGRKILNKPIIIRQQDIDAVKNAFNSVMSHKSKGGPAPETVKEMLTNIGQKQNKITQWLTKNN